jgi:hypothetical protein
MKLFSLLNLGSAMPKVKAMGRYNLAKQTVLPTFGPNKKTQPIGAKAVEVKPAVSASAPVVAVKVEAKPVSASQPAVKKITAGLGWLKKSNPFAAAPATTLSPVATKTVSPAQAELSLDKVRVVRNDLADADIEVVPQTARVPKAPLGTTIPEKRYVRPEARPDQLGKKAWSLLGSRLFGAAAKQH